VDNISDPQMTQMDADFQKCSFAATQHSCIYCHIKTTIDVPEDVLVKAKVLSAEHRTTLRELVVQGLKQVMDAPLADEEKQRKAAIKRWLKGMQASNTEPMVPLKREEIYDR